MSNYASEGGPSQPFILIVVTAANNVPAGQVSPQLRYPIGHQPPEVPMWNEFKTFLVKQNVIALALAVVIGAALGKVVTGVVDDFIMPIVGAMTPGGTWQTATWDVGSVKFGVGNFASVLIDFLIIAFVVWQISKMFIKPEPAVAGPTTKECPFCKMSIDASATRCSHCTSQL